MKRPQPKFNNRQVIPAIKIDTQKTFSEHSSVREEDKKSEKMAPPVDKMETENIEEDIETPGCVDIDQVMEEKKKQDSKQVDLSGEKKKDSKSTYDIDDTIIRDIKLTGDIHVRLISNINGYFVDIRKYQRNFPTKKGIRFLASKFAVAVDYLKQDLEKVLPEQ